MEKTISVEAAAEGPRVKPKRQLTDAQLAALKKGRERLAAKRQAAIDARTIDEPPSEAAIAVAAASGQEREPEQVPVQEREPEQVPVQEQAPPPQEESESDEEYPNSMPCVIM